MSKTRVVWTFEEVHALNSYNGCNPMELKKWNREFKEKNWDCNYNAMVATTVDTILDLLYNDPTPVKIESLMEQFEEDDRLEQLMTKREYNKNGNKHK